MRQVLVIEDEKEISDLLEIHLTDLNCQITKANDGKVGLDLATLPAGWKYEGWTVINGVQVTSGTFTSVTAVDDADPFSSTQPGPPFPGDDYLVNTPKGLTFPTNLAGGTAVISIEPDPDNSPNPFTLKPLLKMIPSDAADHFTYSMDKNLGSFPTGTATK